MLSDTFASMISNAVFLLPSFAEYVLRDICPNFILKSAEHEDDISHRLITPSQLFLINCLLLASPLCTSSTFIYCACFFVLSNAILAGCIVKDYFSCLQCPCGMLRGC